MVLTYDLEKSSHIALNQKQYERSLNYVCHERNFFYIFTEYYEFDAFPLLYLDRFMYWQFSEGPEPITNKYNGLSDFLDSYVRKLKFIEGEELKSHLRQTFSKGSKAQVNLWTKNKAGTPFVTSLLLEGMDNKDLVYITKFNEDWNIVKYPVLFEELVQQLDTEQSNGEKEGEFYVVLEIQESSIVQQLSQLNPIEAFKYIFRELYNFEIKNNNLLKNGNKVEISSYGFTKLVNFFKESFHLIVENNEISKPNQFKLYKFILNRFQPIQFYLEYILTNECFSRMLTSDFIDRINKIKNDINDSLENLMKFASLFFQRPTEKNWIHYINALQRFQIILPDYQQIQLNLIKIVMEENS